MPRSARSPIPSHAGAVLAVALVSACAAPGEDADPQQPLAPLDRIVAEFDPRHRGPGQPRPVDGRWRERRPDGDAELTTEQQEQIERLHAIGYVSGSVKAPLATDVVLHDRDRAYQGLNFYCSGHGPEAVLMDMEGTVLHRWRREFEEIWPGAGTGGRNPNEGFWRRGHLFENGDILVVHEGLGAARLDRDSNVLWARQNRAHHDFEVTDDGGIYLLTRTAHLVPEVSRRIPILEDFVSILDAHGQETGRVSLLDCFENSEDEHSWIEAARTFWEKERRRRLASNPADIFHTNSIELLEEDIAERIPAFAGGDLLVSMCHLDTVAVVDLDACEVVWSLGGIFALQHDPTVTPQGNVMVFDNNWRERRSRVVEVDPATGEIVWQYLDEDERPLFSRTCGTAAPLPNGNTLITESDNGRAIEVTRDHEIVWEFYNPHRAGEHDEYIATLFEVVRLPRDFPVDWADGAAPPE